jgi:hypothetical protein
MGLSREELWMLMAEAPGPLVPPMLDSAYKLELHREWSLSDKSPHGHPWHTCLDANTEVVTRHGIKPISQVVGSVDLLVPERGQSSRGCFKPIVVSDTGRQSLRQIIFVRNRQTKEINATDEHRWYLSDGSVVTTAELAPGMRIKGLSATWEPRSEMVPFAVAQGFVYGGGTRRLEGRPVHLDVHHNGKDEGILHFFAGHRMQERVRTDTGMGVTQVRGLPCLWKEEPSLRESRPFLLSWLAGYFGADGCVGKQGQCVLSSASFESIQFARDVAAICGIGYGIVRKELQSGTYPHGKEYRDSVLFQLTLTAKDLPLWFFVLPKHLQRIKEWSERRMSTREWVVQKVNEKTYVGQTYCASVPDSYVFGLADGMMTGNSFHASAFPGGDPFSCQRLMVYNLLDPPSPEPVPPFLKGWFDLGLNLEHDWVKRLAAYGVLLSLDVNQDDTEFQTGFRDAEHWLTGASDAIVLDPVRRKAHCVEIKTTSHEKVIKMLASNGADVPKSHAKYMRQCGTYIALAHEEPFTPTVTVCTKSGLIMPPLQYCAAHRLETDRPHPLLHDGDCKPEQIVVKAPDDGTLIYSSREEPMTVASFNVRYDPSFMADGRAKLKAAQQSLLNQQIPDHPLEGKKAKWSVSPCQYCPSKKYCKPDYTAKITDLSQSHLIASSKSISPSWDYDEKRNAVLDRWGARREESTA